MCPVPSRETVTRVVSKNATVFISAITKLAMGQTVQSGSSPITRNMLVPITADERSRVSAGAGVITVLSS